ncbi:DUF4375 domain-containing protein [Rhizobium sp. Root482]|uniref:DMP19 family protein n=1 Tax=Rhizobium sp. Root482 TaxID=1736543 RepID=UPI0006F42861|nr:DUF4375 domain-containing protein [Rhizobium sp. Root482]KQY26044.1 hypothetical protein ASD31_20765 [Rhizobium sp. Root482]
MSSRFTTRSLRTLSYKAFDIKRDEMMATYNDLNSLDDWFLRQAIDQAERGISIEDQRIPQTVALLGQPSIYLYATSIFDGEVGNGGVQQFFDNSSGALAPIVRDALQDMLLPKCADIMSRIIDAFGAPFPVSQFDRMDRIDSDPALQIILNEAYDAIDVWSSDYILARERYAKNNHLLK